MKKKNRILITGITGFIGSEICKKLLTKNYIVFGVDDLSTGKNPVPKK